MQISTVSYRSASGVCRHCRIFSDSNVLMKTVVWFLITRSLKCGARMETFFSPYILKISTTGLVILHSPYCHLHCDLVLVVHSLCVDSAEDRFLNVLGTHFTI